MKIFYGDKQWEVSENAFRLFSRWDTYDSGDSAYATTTTDGYLDSDKGEFSVDCLDQLKQTLASYGVRLAALSNSNDFSIENIELYDPEMGDMPLMEVMPDTLSPVNPGKPKPPTQVENHDNALVNLFISTYRATPDVIQKTALMNSYKRCSIVP